ncbi:MAG: 3-methyl-2-oxobutanoate dehydrogenase subunit VorB [Synergistetes bacterium]|nr:3-methyl-2-oxobutanoate dehydrogenase subunit VorB [Synergistota bacterium]MCX8128227.1 3-methyl-2-oxobutanoate dehydrogenase subunit VorB [Synergistota bacterium]MDW8192674.1 3-methyl-2-oxobutanoate dehydrogenase subunit VorB [Synergistota bacterium]
MAEKLLMKGNEVLAEAAVRAGCRFFFGYPITPQNEIPEYMSWRLPEVGGVYLQAESEVAAINMVFGAAGAGARVLTSSSGPGISLMQEGISYIAAAELPCVIINVARGGPGLGGILPAQSDYFQATKGGGHGDYHLIVLAPHDLQEAFDLTVLAFELADKYRNPVMIYVDGFLGQMMEPVEIRDPVDLSNIPPKPWAITGAKGRKRNLIKTLYLEGEMLEAHNFKLKKKYEEIAQNEVRYELYMMEDAEIAISAYGISARISKTAVKILREKGIKIGIIRPITLFPFPYNVYESFSDKLKYVLVVEMSMGQFVYDVDYGLKRKVPVDLLSHAGGIAPTYEEIVSCIMEKFGKGGN